MLCEASPSGAFSLLRSWLIDHRLIESLEMQFYASIYLMEVTSDECLSKVWSLLSCPSKINVARSLRGSEAQMFIDFLDQVSKHACVVVFRQLTTLNIGCYQGMSN